MNWNGATREPVVDAREHGNESVAFIKGDKFSRGTTCVQWTS